MNVLHTRWRALVLALLLAVSLAVPAAAAETETAAEDLQTLADTAASYAAQYGGAQSLQYALWQDGEIVLTGQTGTFTLPWKIQYVDNIRLSFSGENLFVLSGFSGVDPELPAEVGNKYKAGSVGVAISPYPQARKFMFGLNVTF